jgi:hypothetical protein
MTPLRTNNIDDESDLDVIVKGLQQGEESSEEDEVMDIESD